MMDLFSDRLLKTLPTNDKLTKVMPKCDAMLKC